MKVISEKYLNKFKNKVDFGTQREGNRSTKESLRILISDIVWNELFLRNGVPNDEVENRVDLYNLIKEIFKD